MPRAKIINGRYSVILERDRNDPKKPPCNPCKCCCKGARDVAAKYWAIFNMILSVKYSFIKIMDALIWVWGIDAFGWGQKYHLYLDSLYCTESPAATSTSIIMDAVGQLDSTVGGILYLISVLSKRKDLRYRLRLSRWHLFSVCIAFVVFVVSKLTVIIADMQFDEHVKCSPHTYRKTSMIFWSLLMAVWLHISASNSVSFMYWLETRIEEQDYQDSLTLNPQKLLQQPQPPKEVVRERSSMASSNKSLDEDANARVRGEVLA